MKTPSPVTSLFGIMTQVALHAFQLALSLASMIVLGFVCELVASRIIKDNSPAKSKQRMLVFSGFFGLGYFFGLIFMTAYLSEQGPLPSVRWILLATTLAVWGLVGGALVGSVLIATVLIVCQRILEATYPRSAEDESAAQKKEM